MEIVDVDKLVALSLNLRRRLEQESTQASHSIYKAPTNLREVNNKAYEPQMIAIGPYHHGKDKLKKMEKVKLQYMQSLLDREPDVSLECYFSAIARVEKQVRDCYAEPISYSEAEFIEMLVLDGCFIIELIRISRHQLHNERIFYGLKWDLVLLENQIPFFVLCELFNLIFEGPDKHTLLMELVLGYYRYAFPGYILYQPKRELKEVKHILDLVHSNFYPYHVSAATQVSWSGILAIPSASELKDANVKFEAKKYDKDYRQMHESRGTTVFDVEFKEDAGVMLMPPLVISDSTESFLRNLIAYEQFIPTNEPHRFTDYALLLDRLINTSKDVQVLSQHGIIEVYMGSSQDVADFVNRLTENLCFYTNKFLYADTFDRINKHHKKRWNRAVAALNRDYFNSPWAYVSFGAAGVLLLLTVAQTVFAALQQFK